MVVKSLAAVPSVMAAPPFFNVLAVKVEPLIAPDCVIASPAVTFKPAATVDAPRTRALISSKVTFLPEVMLTVEKSLALSSVMSLAAPASNVVVPVTVRAP